jgi:hypothetical protein
MSKVHEYSTAAATSRLRIDATGPANCRRREFIRTLVAGAVVLPLAAPAMAAAAPQMEVWANPSCGCCKDWARHLEENGFDVEMHYGDVGAAKERLGMPVRYGSCHTGAIGGYAVEGHVPAADILRLLKEKPDAAGLSVPAMPRGSPGMDGPAYGGTVDPYDVLLVGHDGSASVWRSYR